MASSPTDVAARHLVAARSSRRPGARLPESCRPADDEAGIAIQRRVGEILELGIGGWKCSLPTAERRLPAASIFAPTIRSVSPCPAIASGDTAQVEPEIAFVMARDLPPRPTPYSEGEVRAAIAEARLVLELMGSRYADRSVITFPELLADSIANQGLFVGPVLSNPLGLSLEAFAIAIDGGHGTMIRKDGRHPDGHPLKPLYWLANFLAGGGYGEGVWLRAKTVVTTGSYCGAVDVPLASPLSVRYGEFGALDVQFSAVE